MCICLYLKPQLTAHFTSHPLTLDGDGFSLGVHLDNVGDNDPQPVASVGEETEVRERALGGAELAL